MKRRSVKVATTQPKKSKTFTNVEDSNSGNINAPYNDDDVATSMTSFSNMNNNTSGNNNSSNPYRGPVVSEDWARQMIKPEDEHLLYSNNTSKVANADRSYNSYSTSLQKNSNKSATGRRSIEPNSSRNRSLEASVRQKQSQKLIREKMINDSTNSGSVRRSTAARGASYSHRTSQLNSSTDYASFDRRGSSASAVTADRRPTNRGREVSFFRKSASRAGAHYDPNVSIPRSSRQSVRDPSQYSGTRLSTGTNNHYTVDQLSVPDEDEVDEGRASIATSNSNWQQRGRMDASGSSNVNESSVIKENEKENYKRNAPLVFRRPSYQIFGSNKTKKYGSDFGNNNSSLLSDTEIKQLIEARAEFIRNLEISKPGTVNYNDNNDNNNNNINTVNSKTNSVRGQKRPEIVLEVPRQIGNRNDRNGEYAEDFNEVYQPMNLSVPLRQNQDDDRNNHTKGNNNNNNANERNSAANSMTLLSSQNTLVSGLHGAGNMGNSNSFINQDKKEEEEERMRKMLLDPFFPVISDENYRRLLIYNLEYSQRLEFKKAFDNFTEPPLVHEDEEREIFFYLENTNSTGRHRGENSHHITNSPQLSPIREETPYGQYSFPNNGAGTRGSGSLKVSSYKDVYLSPAPRRATTGASSPTASKRKKASQSQRGGKGKSSAKPQKRADTEKKDGAANGGGRLSALAPPSINLEVSPITSPRAFSTSPLRQILNNSANSSGNNNSSNNNGGGSAANKMIDVCMPAATKPTSTAGGSGGDSSKSPMRKRRSVSVGTRANSLSSVHLALISKYQKDLDDSVVAGVEEAISALPDEEQVPEEMLGEKAEEDKVQKVVYSGPVLNTEIWARGVDGDLDTKQDNKSQLCDSILQAYIRYVWDEQLSKVPENKEQWEALQNARTLAQQRKTKRLVRKNPRLRALESDEEYAAYQRALLVQQIREMTGLISDVGFLEDFQLDEEDIDADQDENENSYSSDHLKDSSILKNGEDTMIDIEMEDDDFYFDGGHSDNVAYILKLFGESWTVESDAFMGQSNETRTSISKKNTKNSNKGPGNSSKPKSKGAKKKESVFSPVGKKNSTSSQTQSEDSKNNKPIMDIIKREKVHSIELLLELTPPEELLKTD